LCAAGRLAEAEQLLLQSRDLEPSFMWTHYYLADLHVASGAFAEALPSAEKAYALAPWYAPSVGIYAEVLARTGQPDRGKEIVKSLAPSEAYGRGRISARGDR
jgi:predicted Zn-dependent protease